MQASKTNQQATKVPRFLQSLYEILHNEDQSILTWSADGAYFQVLDVARLEREVLPKYFKHGKFTSFQRQLNNFSFRKWTKTRANVCTFSHDVLVRCAYPSELTALLTKYLTSKTCDTTETAATLVEQQKTLKRHRSETTAAVGKNAPPAKKVRPLQCTPLLGLNDLENSTPLLIENLDVNDLCALDWSKVAEGCRGMLLEPLLTDFDYASIDCNESSDWDAVIECLRSIDSDEFVLDDGNVSLDAGGVDTNLF